MIYEIRRNSAWNRVSVAFAEKVPVEVRAALRDAGFWWDWCEKTWAMIDKYSDAEIAGIISSASESVKPRPEMTKDEEKALRAEYMEKVMAGENSERWRKYYEGEIGGLVKLTDGSIVLIRKPKIETDFCFGESGYDADEKAGMADRARSSESYFRSENLKDLKSVIDFLSRDDDEPFVRDNSAIVEPTYKAGISNFYRGSLFDRHSGKKVFDEISEEDRERLLEGYRKVYAAFEKRIDAYLKRYGLSKVHAWTYWLDA